MPKRGRYVFLAAWSVLGVFVAAPGLRLAILAGYPDDSFFTLSLGARTGLAAITAAIALFGGWAAVRLARRMSRHCTRPTGRQARLIANLCVTLGVYSVCYVLSPQLYYTYYRAVILDLPNQWVVRYGDQISRLGSALYLEAGESIASNTAGTLFWALTGLTISIHVIAWRRTGI